MSAAATTVAEDQVSVKSEESFTTRAKFLCSYGGRIMPRPHDGQLRYVGGETRILSVPRALSLADLMFKLRRLCQYDSVVVKYQLPNEDLDALVSVFTDEDLDNMMEEYEKIESKDASSRLRLFLFPAPVAPPPRQGSGTGGDTVQKFVEALNGVYRKGAVAPEAVVAALEEQRKPVVLLQPPSLVDKPQIVQPHPQLPSAGPLQVSSPSAMIPPHVVQPQLAHVTSVVPQFVTPHVLSAAPSPSVLPAAASIAPPLPSVLPAAPASITPPLLHAPAPQVTPTVLSSAAHNFIPIPPSVPPQRIIPTSAPSPVVKVTPPGTIIPQVVPVPVPATVLPQVMTSPGAYVPQVIAARPVAPQVLAAASKPTYVPLVDVSRGYLPKGMILRQYSADDDHHDHHSVSSQSSQVNDYMLDRRDSGELRDRDEERYVIDGRRDYRPVHDNVILQHVPEQKIIRNDPSKLQDTHLERYLVEQTGGDGGVGLTHPAQVGVQLYVPGDPAAILRKSHDQAGTDAFPLPRAASSPDVPVAAAHPFQRQLSDRSEQLLHHQENAIPNVRACIPQDVVVQLDDRFPTPVLHQLNGLRPQQQQQPQPVVISEQVTGHIDPQLMVQKPIKVVPQVVAVSPFKVP